MKKAPISFSRRWLSVLAPGNLRHALKKHSRFANLMGASAILLVIVAAVVWLLSGVRSGNQVRPPSASGPQGVSTVANRGAVVARGPTVLSQPQIRAIKLPPGMFLAQVPFRHDPERIGSPRRVPQSAAGELGSMAMREPPRSSDQVGARILTQRRYMVHRAILPWVDFPGFKLPTPGRLDAAMVSISLDSLNRAGLPWPGCQVRNLPLPGRFITALCRDQTGNIWIATEDHGVYRYDPAAPTGQQVTQFTKQNTHGQLGNNNIYALACDNRGRMWAGTLNHGVSVYNGRHWQDYDIVQYLKHHVLAGPLGNHVFDLQFDKYTDQMWICTEAGISIYQCSSASEDARRPLSPVTFARGTWHYITRADGLPQNPDCLAFAPDGTVYVGTQCSGIAVGTVNEQRSTNNTAHIAASFAGGGIPNSAPPLHLPFSAPYRWKAIRGPWKMPLTATGKGLPGNLLNNLLVEPDGTVVAATDGGLAFGKPASPAGHSAADWTFLRGRDFTAKVAGLWRPPQHWKAPAQKLLNTLPMEDYTTAIAANKQRPMTTDLWLGHRRRGIDVWEYNHAGKLIKRLQIHEPQIGNYITSLLPLPGGGMVVGTYGKGVSIIMLPGASVAWKKTDHASTQPYVAPGFAGGTASTTEGPAAPDTGPAIHEPKSAAAPGVRQLAALYQSLVKEPVSQEPTGLRVVPITDDWRTEGSWLGRYGRYWACLYACSPPPDVGDYVWGPGPLALYHEEGIGPHHRLHDYGRYHLSCGDAIRYYVTWLSTAKKRVLELPEVYLDQCIAEHTATWKADRREAEIDDHGEVYPMSWQGPGLYIYLHIPPGAYTLSLYFFNKDGHSGNNRDRDYVVSIIPVPAGCHFGTASRPNTAPLAAMRGAVQSRVVNFWGGVWKRFLVRGPMKLAIRVAKNYSFNTILQAAMLGPLSEHPAPYYYGYKAWQIHEKQRSGTRTQLAAAWRTGQIPWHRSQQFIPARRDAVNTAAGNPSANSSDQHSGAMAADIIQALNLLEHRNSAAWAANQRLDYTLLLRWCVANYGAIPKTFAIAGIAEKCYYHLNLFPRWEAVEQSRRVLTSRQIEKGLRWDGVHTDYRGFEFHVIRRYIWRLRHRRVAAAEN